MGRSWYYLTFNHYMGEFGGYILTETPLSHGNSTTTHPPNRLRPQVGPARRINTTACYLGSNVSILRVSTIPRHKSPGERPISLLYEVETLGIFFTSLGYAADTIFRHVAEWIGYTPSVTKWETAQVEMSRMIVY